MRTFVYIDGFNLYHGCMQFSAYKWLDLKKLSELLLPGHEIARIKFFTARVSARDDPDQPQRQMTYWRALQTISGLEIIEGTFYESTRSMPLAPECLRFKIINGRPPLVRVTKREEKGSDVNLGCHLVMDGFRKCYEQAAVITNDSDLETPVRIVRQELKFPVWIINPHEHHSKKLKKWASAMARIRQSDLAACQFNEILADDIGQFHKPKKWSEPLPARRFEFSFWKGGMNRLK